MALWRHRDFLLLWSAQGVSAVGSRITRTALPIAAILVAGAGAYDLGLLTVALTLPGAILAWLGGGLVDRHRRRPLMIGADLVRAIALLTIPVAAFAGQVTLPLLYAVATITGVATMLYHLADHVFITDLVPRKRLLDANGKREAVDAIAEITGPAARRRAGRVADRADRDRRRRLHLRRVGAADPQHRQARDRGAATGGDVICRRCPHRHPRRLAQSRDPRAVPGDGDADLLHELHGAALHAVCALRTWA